MEKAFLKIRLALSFIVISSVSLAYAKTPTNPGCLIAGSENATLTIEEFADFECKYCAIGSKTMKEVLKNYPGKINLVFRNRPLPFHTKAMLAAKAMSAVCMQSTELAYSFQDELFDHQDLLIKEGVPFLYETAKKLGVNVAQMKMDMSSAAVAQSIAEDLQLADSYNMKGTPSFMIGTQALEGARSYDEFKKVIDKQLAQ